MWSRKMLVALLSLCLSLQFTAGVVNSGQTKKNEEQVKSVSETKESDQIVAEGGDLVAEGSESANRREAPAILDSYAPPALTSSIVSLPVPIYGVPNTPSNNVVYPAPPPDIPPPLPKPLYGTPVLGNTYGLPQVPVIPKGYGPPSLKYGTSSFGFTQFFPQKLYGPPKTTYGIPTKPFKFHKYPQKNFGLRPPKPVYGTPLIYKDNFSFNKLNYPKTNTFNNLFTSNLYSGVSNLNHQYGAPVLPPKISYSAPPSIGISTQYGIPERTISSSHSLAAYGPPQPSPNPRPPHPGAPAPPTPPDIKYDGWQPIPGLVSKRPIETDIHQVSGEGSGYHDLSPPSLSIGKNQLSETYGTPSITLNVGHLDQSAGAKGVADSYSAPLGTVTGSGGVVTSSGNEAHGAGVHGTSHSNSHSISLDLSSIGIGHGSDIQAVKSIEYNLSPSGGNSLSDTYVAPQIGNFGHETHKTLSGSAIGLVPPTGVYGTPSSQYGIPQYSNIYSNSGYKTTSSKGVYASASKGNSYLPPSPPIAPISSYGVPESGPAISFQNLAYGSSTAGLDIQHSTLNIEGASALPLSSYNVPLGNIDGSYTLPQSEDAGLTVGVDFSHPPLSIDLTKAKHGQAVPHDCYKQQLQVPSLAYGVPSADSYTSALSSLTTNIANSHVQAIGPQATYGVPAPQYGAPDLIHSSSVKSEAKVNSVISENDEETHGKSYGKSVAASFGPNSELVESQSIDLNNIPLQGNLGSYTLQIQSADGSNGQVPHTQVLNDGLLQSILQAIEEPGKQGQENKYPIILQPSVEEENYSVNETISNFEKAHPQASEIREVIVDAPNQGNIDTKSSNAESEETLQLLDTSNIALYFKKDAENEKTEEKVDDNSVDTEEN
ncbi:uncharacterized protein [Euwallacea fornicatus]|uniref:uncharacterized protein n=1 Tax=Euwallacea fornicatus TaxID=995702 RepID=UPI00338F4837